MIVFFVWKHYEKTLTDFFDTWGRGIADRVALVHYERIAELGDLPGASAYVFSDLERLRPEGLRLMSALADAIAATHGPQSVVNHPARVLRRFDFLRLLYERGVNPYQVYRVPPVPPGVRFPVFLRNEHEHEVLTPLLSNRREVEHHLLRSYLAGHDLESLMLVEFQDVSDDESIYHRHIAHVVGDAVFHGYLAFGSSWIVKGGPFLEGERLVQQRASILPSERDPTLLELARLAGVGYGRFDYAMVDDRICIWELNTNPTLLLRREAHSPEVMEEIRPLADRLIQAFQRLAGEQGRTAPPVQVPQALLTSAVARPRRRSRRASFLRKWQPIGGALRPAAPLLERAWIAAESARARLRAQAPKTGPRLERTVSRRDEKSPPNSRSGSSEG